MAHDNVAHDKELHGKAAWRDADSDGPAGPPDTVAAALAYDGGAAPPRVVAAGRGHVAEQILALAFDHGVRVRQDADLAQMLAAVDVDSEIPAEAFAAVAEILAYVYRANGGMPEPPNADIQGAAPQAEARNQETQE